LVARKHLSRRGWLLAGLLVVALAAVVAHPVWMSALGGYLVRAEEPAPADIAVVPAGDGFGNRILKAADLVRRGFTPRVLVSGPDGMYDSNEADLAIAYVVHRGNPPAWFIRFPIKAYSTREEARLIVPELRRLGVRRVLLVTSDYHTRRAGAIYRAAAPEIEFRVVAAPDRFFRSGEWWRTREGQKRFVLEWMKTIAGWFGV
jgi:uncharacterized SAM-binding protein YcdF (DUF218 family)